MTRHLILQKKWLLIMVILGFALSGCTTDTAVKSTSPIPAAAAPPNIELLLLKAGFETVLDTHPKCEKFCRELPAGQILPYRKGDKKIYGYLSPETGRLYIGNEAEFQRFINLAVIQKIEERHRPVADERTDPEFWQMWVDRHGGSG